VDSLWEHLGSIGIAVGFGVSLCLGWFRLVSWPVSVLLFFGVVALGYILFPYITPFVIIQKKPEHDKTPSA
jgi:hypothetical protein